MLDAYCNILIITTLIFNKILGANCISYFVFRISSGEVS